MFKEILECFRTGIKERFKVSVSGNSFCLVETADDAVCKEIYFNTEGIHPILINLDQNGIHPLLSDTITGLQKRSDYIIICPTEDKLYFLIVEIKSNTPRQWRSQCFAGECLATYIISTIERVNKIEITKHIEFRHILFTSSQQFIAKKPTGKGTGSFYHIKDDKASPYIEKTCRNKEPYQLKTFLI